MTAVAVATPNATDPETRQEYRMLARIKRNIVKGVIVPDPCKSAIYLSLQPSQRVIVYAPASPAPKAAKEVSLLLRIPSVEINRPTSLPIYAYQLPVKLPTGRVRNSKVIASSYP